MRQALLSTCVAFALVAGSTPARSQSLLIDDFSVDQQGIAAGRFAESDLLEDARLFQGSRELWGGGDTNCPTSEITLRVADGFFQVTPGSDCPGSGNVTWPRISTDLEPTFDLSEFTALLIDVAEVSGQVNQQVTIRPANSGPIVYLPVIDSPGTQLLRFPDAADLSRIRRITISSGLGMGESLSINAVWLVPEPTGFAVVGALLATVIDDRNRAGLRT